MFPESLCLLGELRERQKFEYPTLYLRPRRCFTCKRCTLHAIRRKQAATLLAAQKHSLLNGRQLNMQQLNFIKQLTLPKSCFCMTKREEI